MGEAIYPLALSLPLVYATVSNDREKLLVSRRTPRHFICVHTITAGWQNRSDFHPRRDRTTLGRDDIFSLKSVLRLSLRDKRFRFIKYVIVTIYEDGRTGETEVRTLFANRKFETRCII